MGDLFRPERMSKVSVTGAKSVMDDVVDVAHDLHLLHVSDYDGSWEGFSPGDPAEGADEVSEKLVTVRSLESILDVDEDDAGARRLVTEESMENELEEIRKRVNELDDRREALSDQLRAIEDTIDAMEPFAELGIDLDLLAGYGTIQVAVGEGDEEAVHRALADADDVRDFELFTGDGVVAAFARPAAGAPGDALAEALVGVEFGQLEVPDLEDGPVDVETDRPTPEAYVEELRAHAGRLESKLNTVENELEDEKLDVAGYLLAVEETLTIEVQKREAPLSFATTDNAFVAEGWIPAERYDEFAETITETVDGRVEIEELERADYEEGHPTHEEQTAAGAAAADGGTTVADDPPVLMDNPAPSEPFEVLVQAVELPRYDEFDPTVLLWLTFPAFFGFMIGDVGYGILYVAIGYWLYRSFDAPGLRALGGVAMWAGGFTILFGVLYGELFGLHQIGELYGGPVMHKGLQPAEIDYAVGWIVVTVLVGVLHVTLGYTLSFAKHLRHGVGEALLEDGPWVLMMWGLWGWVFSRHLADTKPPFLVGSESVFNGHPLPLGFTGLPAEVGIAAAVAFGLGLLLTTQLGVVEAVEAFFLQVLVRALSYTRIAAVLLAKAGMAFVVNLLVFGMYTEETGHGTAFHFLFFSDHHVPAEDVVFAGVLGGGSPVEVAVGWLAGVLIFVIGHLVVLGLGVTSAGLQAVRLEYVEFFQEFYDGGGDPYRPFGTERRFTAED